jgi:histidine triad (HIT) family protein
MGNCVFCDTIAGKSPGKIVWQNDEFMCLENKYPHAPVHVLVMPKTHLEKKQVRDNVLPGFHEKMMNAVFETVRYLGLDAKGYRLINNGAGYNHLEHEHWHILSGLKEKQE